MNPSIQRNFCLVTSYTSFSILLIFSKFHFGSLFLAFLLLLILFALLQQVDYGLNLCLHQGLSSRLLYYSWSLLHKYVIYLVEFLVSWDLPCFPFLKSHFHQIVLPAEVDEHLASLISFTECKRSYQLICRSFSHNAAWLVNKHMSSSTHTVEKYLWHNR